MTDLRSQTDQLVFGTYPSNSDPDLNSRPIIQFSIIVGYCVLSIKYELKEFRMNIYVMFWRGRPSDNKRRWRRFVLCGCFLG